MKPFFIYQLPKAGANCKPRSDEGKQLAMPAQLTLIGTWGVLTTVGYPQENVGISHTRQEAPLAGSL